MKNKDKNVKAKKSKLNVVWIVIIFIITLILSVFYISYIKDLVYKNVYSNISELSEQTATQLELAISEQKNFVDIMVDSINRGYFKTTDEIFDRFKEDLDNYDFTRLVILDKNGNGKTSDGYTVTNYANIEEFFAQEEVYLSDNRPSTVSNYQVNIYSKIFTFKGEEKVLMATIRTEDYKGILLRRLFGKGGTYLINNDGTVLIDSFDNIKGNNLNFYDYVKDNYNLTNKKELQKIDDMLKGIKEKKIGTFDIRIGNETYFIHYEKVGINDWYVITTASDSTIAKELIWLVIISLLLCLLINFIIICISIYINISNQKKNKKLYKVAYIDPITELGNETYFKENGANYLQNKSNKNKYIVSIDINKFKALNNIYGYEFCNNILKELGKKLEETLPQDNISCRISNDIFATLFSYQRNINDLLDKVFNNVSVLNVNGTNIHVNLAIGAYKIIDEDTDINKILDKAYMARAQIKGLYNNNYYIYDEKLENEMLKEQKIESCMEDALKNNEFEVVYQPKILVKNEKIVGAEALVRWKKDGQTISPGDFIPLFEKNKFIIKLDLYVFEQACKDIASWNEKYDFVPTVSINVSKEHFNNEDFIKEYVKITDKYNIDRSKIDLEITESATVDQNIDILKVLNTIKENGFIISLDDFGTGYSSLSMLQTMPIDIIKIDKVFIRQADYKSDKNIINYIMLIAEHLGAKTILEGVETKEQVEFTRKIGCDIIQGYYYSKPLSKNEYEDYFNKNK
ncbi:MAG: EAL domain-containing protein [Clostridia bacterium]|nr:EAL domain-containing protein [Clostridia bacterium]